MLNRFFGLTAHGTTLRTELLAGFTTFLTMAYIVVVNPVILGDAGMPVAAVAAATCFAALGDDDVGAHIYGEISGYGTTADAFPDERTLAGAGDARVR